MPQQRIESTGNQIAGNSLVKFAYDDEVADDLRQPDPLRPGEFGYFSNVETATVRRKLMEKEIEILKLLNQTGVKNVPQLIEGSDQAKIAYLADGKTIFPVNETLFSQELIDGRDTKSHRLSNIKQTISRTTQLIEILSAAYKAGVIAHHNIGPHNIIDQSGEINLVDWGSAEANGLPTNLELGREELSFNYISLAYLFNSSFNQGEKTDTVSLAKTMLYWLSGGSTDVNYNSQYDLQTEEEIYDYAIYATKIQLSWLNLAFAEDLDEAVKYDQEIFGEEVIKTQDMKRFQALFEEAQKWDLPSELNRFLYKIIKTDLDYAMEFLDNGKVEGIELVSLEELKQELAKYSL